MSVHIEIPYLQFSIKHCVAGSVIYPPGGTYGPVKYVCLQLLHLQSGSMHIHIDDVIYYIPAGKVVVMYPGQRIYIEFDKTIASAHRWVTIFPHEDDTTIAQELMTKPVLLPLSHRMNQLLDLLVELQREDGPEQRPLQQSLGLSAVQLYFHEIKSLHEKHPAISHVKEFIYNSYAEEITLSDMATHAEISASHLTRLFRNDEGMSPIKYLWQYRVERGLDLLQTTGLSITEIAELCGFKTPYHFARLVKQQTGLSPTQFRRT